MSDADLNATYPGYPASSAPNLASHASTPVHTGDPKPVVISARGRHHGHEHYPSENGNNHRGGQHQRSQLHWAEHRAQGRDEHRRRLRTSSTLTGQMWRHDAIQVGGPGYVLVQAGGTIDLGYSNGIQAIGNAANQYLSETGSSLIVAAGPRQQPDNAGRLKLFRQSAKRGHELQHPSGQRRYGGGPGCHKPGEIEHHRPLPPDGESRARISTMTSSQISTVGGGSLSIIATGSLNVGTTMLPSTPDEHRLQTDGHPHRDRRRHQCVCQRRRERERGPDHDLPRRGHHRLERQGEYQRGKGQQGRGQREPAHLFLPKRGLFASSSPPLRSGAASGR